jgi:hypothetical protein
MSDTTYDSVFSLFRANFLAILAVVFIGLFSHSVFSQGCPTGFSSLGGIVYSSPTAETFNGKVYVFIKGTDGAVYYKTSNGGAFSEFVSLGGIITSTPAAATDGIRLFVEATGTDGARYYQSTTNGSTFSSWIKSSIVTESSQTTSLNNNEYMFVQGTGSQPPLCFLMQPTPTPTPPPSSPDCQPGFSSLGGIITHPPTAEVFASKIYVFARGTDGAVYYQTSKGRAFSGYKSLGGIITSAPVSTTDGISLSVEGTGTDNFRYYKTTTTVGHIFSEWVRNSITTQAKQTVFLNGNTYVFAQGIGPQPPLCVQLNGNPGPTPTPVPIPTPKPVVVYQEAVLSLNTNRNRLLDSYALFLSNPSNNRNRQQLWNSLTTSQKGVFLTITDLLGRRTFLRQNRNFATQYYPDSEDYNHGCAQMNAGVTDFQTNGVYIYLTEGKEEQSCQLIDIDTCISMGKCTRTQLPRIDFDTALNHVTKLYSINGQSSAVFNCGGEDSNRLFFSVDNELIYALRNIDSAAPVGWRKSQDYGGPHSPFTQSRETNRGRPRGQIHEFGLDSEAQYMNRPGVYGVYDPHIAEMDIDYNSVHDSNPECSYPFTSGRNIYQNFWSGEGLGGLADYNYYPY